MRSRLKGRRRGLTLIEMLVYITVLMAILGAAYGALHRLWKTHAVMRREADDLRDVLTAGEHWRADVREAAGSIRRESEGPLVYYVFGANPTNSVQWAFHSNAAFRRAKGETNWMPVLGRLRTAQMTAVDRGGFPAWRWELELEPANKKSRYRRQFAFLAVPPSASVPATSP